jgi:hypothetical protein
VEHCSVLLLRDRKASIVSMQLSESEIYTSATGALDGFLNLQPLVASIERVLNDYRPAAYAIAFVLLVVGTMREFIYPETRRFLDAMLRAILLVASISFAPDFIDWCDQAAQALAELPAAEQVNLGDSSYLIKPGQAPAITQLEQVLQEKVKGSDTTKGGSEINLQAVRRLHNFLRIRWILERMWESRGVTSQVLHRIWPGRFYLRFTSYACCFAKSSSL